MAGESIRRVAAIGTGTIGASWIAVFLAHGLTVSASDPAPGAETFLREFIAAAWPSLARLSPLPAEPPWAARSFHTQPEAAVVGAEFIQESAPEREARLVGPARRRPRLSQTYPEAALRLSRRRHELWGRHGYPVEGHSTRAVSSPTQCNPIHATRHGWCPTAGLRSRSGGS